jgi:hypothetical protein
MIRSTLFPILALLNVATPAVAQDAGGVPIKSNFIGSGAVKGLAQPLPFTRTFVTARDVQGGLTPADHQAQNQNTITKLRGDAGFLAGFHLGQPLAPSRQILQDQSQGGDPGVGGDQSLGFDQVINDFGFHRRQRARTVIINNLGPLALTNGNGNVVQQQFAPGSGPVAQQQVATTPAPGSSGGGALNLVAPGGNIIQRAPR